MTVNLLNITTGPNSIARIVFFLSTNFQNGNRKLSTELRILRNETAIYASQLGGMVQIKLLGGGASSREAYACCQYRYVFQRFRAGPCCYDPLKETPGVVKRCLTVKVLVTRASFELRDDSRSVRFRVQHPRVDVPERSKFSSVRSTRLQQLL